MPVTETPGGQRTRWLLRALGGAGWLLVVDLVLVSTVRSNLPRPLGVVGGWAFVIGGTALLAGLAARDLVEANARRGVDEGARTSRLAVEHARRHLTILARASEVLSTAIDDFEPNMVALVDLIVPDFADLSAVDLVEPSGPLRRIAIGQIGGQSAAGVDALCSLYPRWGEMAGKVMRSGSSDVVWAAADGNGAGEFSLVVAPIRVSGLTLGVLTVATEASRRGFRPSDVSVVEEIAGRAAIAMERVLLYREVAEAATASNSMATRLRNLVDAALDLQSKRDAAGVLGMVANHALGVLNAGAALVVATGDGGEPRFAAMARRGEPVIGGTVEDVSAVTELPWTDGATAPEGWLVVALRGANGRCRGWLGADGSGGVGSDDETMLLLLAQMIAAALDGVELYETVETREARWRALVETAPAGIIEVGLDGKILLWNRSAAALFAWSEHDDVVTAPAFDAATAERLSQLSSDAAAIVEVVEEELELAPSSGCARDGRTLAVSVAPLVSASGSVESTLILAVDVSERRRFEDGLQQAQRMEALGEVAGGVAHDFNNLLTVIGGYTELLAHRTKSDGPNQKLFDAIRSATDRAAMLTRQLLAISRRQLAEPVAIDVDASLRGLASVVERVLGFDVSVCWDLAPAGGTIRIDPGRFDQAIFNLAINARDAMPAGGRLSIATTRLTLDRASSKTLGVAPGAYICITVADTGTGMDDETRKHCFEPFFTTKDRSGGTGLGLAAVRGIVADGGGTVTVESRPGLGTTFVLYLAAAEETPEVRIPLVIGPRPRGRETVLVVEDQPDVRDLISRTLGRDGYSVFCADCGESAIAIARESVDPIDILITDVVMPGLRGPEVAAAVTEIWPLITVLFISGYTHGTTLPAALADDPLGFLAKPFKPSELAERVRALLDLRQPARSDSPHPEPS